jgi:hypothetical protein
MPRWTPQEHAEIAIVRTRLADLLAASPNFPEVVGDRKIIRFLRGHDHNVDKVCDLYGKFLVWRKECNVDEIRRNIVEGGMDHPLKFPKGEIIQSVMPALIIAPDSQDSYGCPIVVDQYNFSPQTLLDSFTIEDYILYATYCLEYRQIILEQMSEEREEAYLCSLTPLEREEAEKMDSDKPCYGVITQSCVIRDLNGVGFEHLSARGQEIIRAVIAIASDNYPELMRKAFMINTPWIFNTVWFFIKGLLAAKTVAKISMMGATFMDEIEKEIRRENIPALVGGPYIGYQQYVAYPFNRSYLCPMNIVETVMATVSKIETVFVEGPVVAEPSVASIVLVGSTVTESSSGENANTNNSEQGLSKEIDIGLITLQTSG